MAGATRCSKWLKAIVAATLIASTQGQYLSLHKALAPTPHALATVARFFVYSKHGAVNDTVGFNLGKMPPVGWGIWDKKYALPAKIMIHELGLAIPDQTQFKEDLHLDIAIMEYDDFWDKFVPWQQGNHFCSTVADVTAGNAEKEHQLMLPPTLKSQAFTMPVPVGALGSIEVKENDFHVPRTGIYFLMIVNCGTDVPPKAEFTGAVTARGAHGFLSGMDVPKLALYCIGFICYGVLGLLWAIWWLRYRRQLIVLHHLIGGVIGLGLLEQLAWWLHLSWANVVTPPSDVLLILSITLSMLKNVTSCVLILLASLGYCITRPSLEPATKAKIWAAAIALAVLDAAKQLATHYHIPLDLSVVILIMCALPITLLYFGGLIWSFSSLNALILELKHRRQTAKFRQMTRFRCVLVFASICVVASSVVETYVLSMDLRKVWALEWIFTDAVPNSLFYLILLVTAALWRPTRSSKYFSYNLQLPDTELGESTLDIDRIRADLHGKAFEITFDSPATTGATDPRTADIRAWGEVDLDMDEDDALQPVAERRHP